MYIYVSCFIKLLQTHDSAYICCFPFSFILLQGIIFESETCRQDFVIVIVQYYVGCERNKTKVFMSYNNFTI